MIAATQLGSFIVNLGHHSKIPLGEGRVFQIGPASIAVFHTPDGSVFATERNCPQKGCPIVEGSIVARKVICPVHGLAFDLSDGQPAESSSRALKTYPAMVNEIGNILVGVEKVLAATR